MQETNYATGTSFYTFGTLKVTGLNFMPKKVVTHAAEDKQIAYGSSDAKGEEWNTCIMNASSELGSKSAWYVNDFSSYEDGFEISVASFASASRKMVTWHAYG